MNFLLPQEIVDTFIGNNFSTFAFDLFLKQVWLKHVSLVEAPAAEADGIDPALARSVFRKDRRVWDIENISVSSKQGEKSIYAKLKNTEEDLTTTEITKMRIAEARTHPKKWMPPAELLLEARKFAAKNECDPFDYPPYGAWKHPAGSASDTFREAVHTMAANNKVRKSSKRKHKEKMDKTSIVQKPAPYNRQESWKRTLERLDWTLKKKY